MAKSLETKVSKTRLISKQFSKYKSGGYEHKGYYLANVVRIIFGREPSHVSPDNKIVNSYLKDY